MSATDTETTISEITVEELSEWFEAENACESENTHSMVDTDEPPSWYATSKCCGTSVLVCDPCVEYGKRNIRGGLRITCQVCNFIHENVTSLTGYLILNRI